MKEVPFKYMNNEIIGTAQVHEDGTATIQFNDTDAAKRALEIITGPDPYVGLSIGLDATLPTEWNDNAYTVRGEPATLIDNIVVPPDPRSVIGNDVDVCMNDYDGLHFFRGSRCIYCDLPDPLINNVFDNEE